ncbi:hypothetical protein ACSQ67_001759 [Phaseolus vulgaris]
MSFSTPPVESRIQFSPLPQDIEEHDLEINDRHRIMEPCEERFDWDAVVILLRLTMIAMLFIGLALHQTHVNQPTFDPVPPKFFLDSFHVPHLQVSDGEVSSTWDMTVTICNGMNYSKINILKLEAKISYEENEALAVITPITPQYMLRRAVLLLDKEATKKVHLKLSTTGWEKDQPIVDDTVVQAIAEDMQRGITRFSLHMTIVGEAWLDDGLVENFIMYPKCSNLVVKFAAGDLLGKTTTTIIDHKECVGLIQWGPLKNT